MPGTATFGLFLHRVLKFFGRRDIRIVTFTGPSGAGKTTIVGELLKRYPKWKMVLSLTSREPRNSDLSGEYRCNVSREEFLQIKEEKKDLWIESAHGNMYATLGADIIKALLSKGLSLMQLLPVSVRKIHDYIPGSVLSIFILPPGEEELRRRLEKRGESSEQIEKRIIDCRNWEAEATKRSGIPYKFVRNDGTVEEAVKKIEDIIKRNI
jgi:guanylate kinase